ncbi:MAG: substrate-binding domain-containing protein [bacterium]
MKADSEATVVEQVGQHVRDLIASKGLKRGDSLPSYRQLAQDLQVGYTTVKLAMDALEEHGIVQRQAARGCFVNRELSGAGRLMKKMGIIYPASRHALFSSPYLLEILRGFHAVEGAFGDLHIFSLRQDGLVSAAQIAAQGVDGVVLLGVENDDYLRAFHAWEFPGVVVDYHTADMPLDCVVCDNAAGARRAVRQVLELGHRRLLYVERALASSTLTPGANDPLPLKPSDAIERRDAVSAELRAAAPVRWDVVALWNEGDVKETAFRSAWDRAASAWSGRPTVVLTDDEVMARTVALELAELGLRVPEDVSVCALAMAGEVKLGDRPLTGCRFDFVSMGQQAVSLLQNRYENPTTTRVVTHRIGFEFVEGQTVKRVEG